MLDWNGDSLNDIYTDLVRRADESAGADRTDPYSSYGGYSTWLRSRRQWCRERAELVARLDLLAALRDRGRPAPPGR
jgi:hypothetical protein